MVILGLLLMLGGALVVLAGLFTADGTAQFLGTDVSAAAVFFFGVAAGVAVLWGFSIMKFGTKRSIQHRRDAKKLNELSRKLDRVESERADDDTDTREQHRGEHSL
ncbi:hypothetical protein [Nocardioides sp. LS1]|uniref:hypothetical protein n=1 Tax=Nocardioides sp. LS1 TaxID=1027620 RepID=UPI000F623204|nr:hypothetical protein [Nocardioides sp. LS1]GCD89808.1 hypothetical protein NLS1_18140 [Nocardioides sp. LS1]